MYLVLWQLTFAGAPFRGQNRISKVVSGLAGSPCTFDTIDYPYSNLCFESAIYFVGIFTLTLPMISVDCNWSETLARKAYGYSYGMQLQISMLCQITITNDLLEHFTPPAKFPFLPERPIFCKAKSSKIFSSHQKIFFAPFGNYFLHMHPTLRIGTSIVVLVLVMGNYEST